MKNKPGGGMNYIMKLNLNMDGVVFLYYTVKIAYSRSCVTSTQYCDDDAVISWSESAPPASSEVVTVLSCLVE